MARKVDGDDVALSTKQRKHRPPGHPRHPVRVDEQERFAFTGPIEGDGAGHGSASLPVTGR